MQVHIYLYVQYLICSNILWEKAWQMGHFLLQSGKKPLLHSDLGKKPVNTVVVSGFTLQIICRFLALIIV